MPDKFISMLSLLCFNTITRGKRSFQYYGVNLWNILPRKAANSNIFKKLVKY